MYTEGRRGGRNFMLSQFFSQICIYVMYTEVI